MNRKDGTGRSPFAGKAVHLLGAAASALLPISMAGAAMLADADAQQSAASLPTEEIVITGSRIRQPNLTAISPVTAVSAAEIKAQGITKIEDLVNSLPQAFAAQGAAISNGADGTATVDLRGLGPSRTLVLVDGRRLGPGVAGSSAADLNFIPASLVKRVDIVTGGASAVYGSDALGGAVNFIMNRELEGLLIEATSGVYQHTNDNAGILAPSVNRNFKLPPKKVSDGETSDFTIAMGAGSADGKAHVVAYATYRSVEKILQGDRDYSNCTLNSGDSFTCGGSGTAFPARIGSKMVEGTGDSRILRPRVPSKDVYNFGPTNYYQRPDERYTLGAFAKYAINAHAEAYADLMFMNDTSVAQIAPGGIFAGRYKINCDNAFASAQQLAEMCGANAGNSKENFEGTVARRNIEGGGRRNVFEFSNQRAVAGVRGEIAQGWDYDVSAVYYKTTRTTDTLNYFLKSRIESSLIARRDSSGKIVCQSVLDGTDPACVPYNLFDANGVTQAMLDYLQAPGTDKGVQTQRILSASFSGDVGQYGVKSPWATKGLGLAFGVESREDTGRYAADYLQKQDLLSGAGGASPDLFGRTHVNEWFVEARMPLVENKPFAKALNIDGGYRSSDYDRSGKVEAYKYGGDWSPTADLRLRASYQKAVRGPNISEMFSPQNVVLDGTTDPCAGTLEQLAKRGITAAQCALTGVTAAQFGQIEENPAKQYNGLTGGSLILKPETGTTKSFGFIARPSFVPGLTASVDYFDINVEDFIGGVGADLAIDKCISTGNPFYCNLIKRDSEGSLWLSNQGYIIDTLLNTGSLSTKGVDLNVTYDKTLDDWGLKGAGSIAINFVGTYLDSYEVQSLPGEPIYDCKGLYGNVCGVPRPEWRHKARVTWNTPFWGVATSLQWRHFNPVTAETGADAAATDIKLEQRDYFDLSGSIDFAKHYTFRVGANNVFDKAPPLNGSDLCPTGSCNGNTWAQVYDSAGRYVYATLTAKW